MLAVGGNDARVGKEEENVRNYFSRGKRSACGVLATVAMMAMAGTARADSCEDVAEWNPSWEAFEAEVVKLVNQKRAAGATCGGVAQPAAAPLLVDIKLRCAARKHAKDMGNNNSFRATGTDGSTYSQRIKSAGYKGGSVSEIINAGHATPAAVVDAWMASKEHCRYIMNPGFVHMGLGYYFADTSTYKHYWTQNFGKP